MAAGETTIERVEHWGGRAITDARVYALEYSSSGERFLFWMQVAKPRARLLRRAGTHAARTGARLGRTGEGHWDGVRAHRLGCRARMTGRVAGAGADAGGGRRALQPRPPHRQARPAPSPPEPSAPCRAAGRLWQGPCRADRRWEQACNLDHSRNRHAGPTCGPACNLDRPDMRPALPSTQQGQACLAI
jgi:hypothetical protein